MKNKLIESPINQVLEKLKTFTFNDNTENVEYINQYNDCIQSLNVDLQYLGNLETLILQINASKFTTDDIILFTTKVKLNTYINARVGFYRPNTQSDTIRIVVGNSTNIGENIILIKSNKELMNTVHQSLSEKMNQEIKKTKNQLESCSTT
jgi:hypothetical protein